VGLGFPRIYFEFLFLYFYIFYQHPTSTRRRIQRTEGTVNCVGCRLYYTVECRHVRVRSVFFSRFRNAGCDSSRETVILFDNRCTVQGCLFKSIPGKKSIPRVRILGKYEYLLNR
jgi:hypothetical protein